MIAYNETWLRNLSVYKEAKRWTKKSILFKDQLERIRELYPSPFYHPNFFIRILLFIATLIAAAGITGIFVLIFSPALETEASAAALSTLYGIGSGLVLELLFIKRNKHYKSGVNEALLYHSVGYTLLGLLFLVNFNEHFFFIFSLILCSFAAIRYADVVATCCTIGSFAGILFLELHAAGGLAQQVIPFVFMGAFGGIYFVIKKCQRNSKYDFWKDCLIVSEVCSLLIVYAAGNYFVVRELSISMMDMYLADGEDIPFAYLFYLFTVGIPVLYLYKGLTTKNIILLRVSLIVLAFTVFTFKYYFSLGHPEITLTVSGMILVSSAMILFKYLRTPKNGFTRENLLDESWANSNAEGFFISQTLGGNQVTDGGDHGGGGQSGGGGSSDSW